MSMTDKKSFLARLDACTERNAGGHAMINGGANTFRLIYDDIGRRRPTENDPVGCEEDCTLAPTVETFRLRIHDQRAISQVSAPNFDHGLFFEALKEYNERNEGYQGALFGEQLLYGNQVTSTNTMLERSVYWSLLLSRSR